MTIRNLEEIAHQFGKNSNASINMSAYDGKKEELAQEIEFISTHRHEAVKLLNTLYENKIPITHVFYTKLRNYSFAACLNKFSQGADRLIGILLVEACKKISCADMEKLLSLLAEKEQDIFFFLGSLPIIVAELALSPAYAAALFKSIEKRVRNDLAGGSFFDSITTYCKTSPEKGLAMLNIYRNENLDEGTTHLASFILGYIRTIPSLPSDINAKVEEVENSLKLSRNNNERACYYRSWSFSYIHDPLPLDELAMHIDQMIADNAIDEALGTIRRCMYHKIAEPEIVSFAFDFIERIPQSSFTPAATHTGIEMLWTLLAQTKPDKGTLDRVINILLLLLPIPIENKGTWDTLRYFLRKLIGQNLDYFCKAIEALADRSFTSFIHQLDHSDFHYTFLEASKHDLSGFVATLLFSSSDRRRAVGVRMFCDIESMSLPKELIEKYDVELIKAAAVTFTLWTYRASSITRFYLMFEPIIFEMQDERNKEWFINEMVYQAMNYPGEVLDAFKAASHPSEILSRVIKSADEYFEELGAAQKSPVNSFSFPEYHRATIKAYQTFSSEVSKGAREKSVFAKLFHNVNITYGNEFSFYQNGIVSPPLKSKAIEHSMEFPRLEIIDPEGATWRRIVMIKAVSRKKNSLKTEGRK